MRTPPCRSRRSPRLVPSSVVRMRGTPATAALFPLLPKPPQKPTGARAHARFPPCSFFLLRALPLGAPPLLRKWPQWSPRKWTEEEEEGGSGSVRRGSVKRASERSVGRSRRERRCRSRAEAPPPSGRPSLAPSLPRRKLAELGRSGGAGAGPAGGRMMRSQCLLGLRAFLAFAAKLWGFLLYLLRRQARTVIQYQTVRYDILPLSKVSRERLNQVKRKILVLDLDETLIHSHHDGVLRPTVRPGTPPDFILKVVIDKHPVRFFVHKRPHVDFFLEVVSQWYELVVFTASMEIYGSAVADKLDNNRSILKRRYYRQHCTLELGSYIKDLSVVHTDLSSIVILDNSPGAYRSHPDNAIPIKSWFSDPSDTALLNLLPMLDALRFTADVRSVLSRNLHQHRLW
nr:PREDICTED: CTD nuclear envelope phosphatase 1 [Anolis carolinensis]|eukprot:XP_003230103.2 PREDICTED: CTD nuclear envelope phosphatase 1 [Anolis carolinensis]